MVDTQVNPYSNEQNTGSIHNFDDQHEVLQKTRKEKVFDLNGLKPGDHISFYKTDFYYSHHGIVVESRTDYLRVIHYFNTASEVFDSLLKGSLYIAEIIESEWPVDLTSTTEDIYTHHYENIRCFSNEETLKRAFSQLGRRGYSLFANNCEHWARWCRTGQHYSEQITAFRKLVTEKAATLLIVDPMALLIKDISLVGAQTFPHFLGALGSGLILTAVEGVSAYVDIKKKVNQYNRGHLSDIALKKYIVRRVTSASTTVAGGVAGTILGTILIPVPILGAAIGGTLGSIGGKIFGGITGIALSKILEVHKQKKQQHIAAMTTIPRLMANLSLESEIVQGLMTVSLDDEERERIEQAITETIETKTNVQSLYPCLEQFIKGSMIDQIENYQKVRQLITRALSDNDDSEDFILTPVPDSNAHDEFASSIDLLVLRWPNNKIKPWDLDTEHVLEINDM